MKNKFGIVAFAFGPEPTLRSNINIGHVASNTAVGLHAPIFRQCKIPLKKIASEVTDADEQNGSWANTLQMAYEAVCWAIARGLKELYVAAAAPHLQRCVRDLKYVVKKLGKYIKVCVCPGINDYENNDWFCQASSQWRTRSWWFWWFGWEWWVSLLPWWLYRRLSHVPKL